MKENFELKETLMQANFQLRSNECGLHDALDLASVNAALEQQLKVLEHQHTELSDLITKTDKLATGNTISQDSHSKKTESAHNTDEMLISVQEDWCGRGSHIELKRGETIPLEKGRVLVYEINREVVETCCKDVKFAWKKIGYLNKIQIEQVKKVKVLKILSRHHIVKLVGTYTQQPYLGLLIWPVARYDLA